MQPDGVILDSHALDAGVFNTLPFEAGHPLLSAITDSWRVASRALTIEHVH